MSSRDDHVRGVAIAPPGCETLHLTFGRTGRLIEYCAAPFGDPTPGRYGLIHKHIFTKTQFSSYSKKQVWTGRLLGRRKSANDYQWPNRYGVKGGASAPARTEPRLFACNHHLTLLYTTQVHT